MFGAKVKLKDAERVQNYLKEQKLLDTKYNYIKNKEFIYFPLKKKSKIPSASVVEKKFLKSTKKTGSLKDLLKNKLNSKELDKLKGAYDIVGSIAILEIDKILRKKEKLIAEAVLSSNKNIKTVLRKDASHEGEFRTQKMKYLAGIKTKETIHKENNVKIKLDVEKVYFSARLSTERKRISKQVKKGENILVMFSGCAPYPCVLSKNTSAKEIVGIEINPEGHKYGVENIKLNKLKNVILINGDVKKDIPLFAKKKIKFDRILMPLPKSAENFLKEALTVSKKGTIIHFYNFLHEQEFKKAEQMINKVCKKWKKISLIKCGQQAPHVYRICLDFVV